MRSARIKLPGHPDKACDLVAEAIVDEYLRRDSETRIHLHVTGGRGALFVAGEVKSRADFDVSALVRKTLGGLGIVAELEPFVAVEQVPPEQVSCFANGHEILTTASGYATNETSSLLPSTVDLAKQIAKRLEDLRTTSDQWFWLGPDAEIVVHADGSDPTSVHLLVEHANQSLEDVRKALTVMVHTIAPFVFVRVNELGPVDQRGLGNRIGASGGNVAPYGDVLPFVSVGSGRDQFYAEKAGAWLARSAARSLVIRGAKAAFVTLVFAPGEMTPMRISARDERGKDLSKDISKESVSLERVIKEWWRPGLHVEAARWGFAGEPGLPWEN